MGDRLLASLHVVAAALIIGAGSAIEADEQRSPEACHAAYARQPGRFKELSAIMAKDFGWDILRRNGNSRVCLGERHRFFFVLFFYRHWKTPSTTADFGVCVPRECDDATLRYELLPYSMYRHFFDEHTDFHPDGSIDHDKSVHYAFNLKEYKLGLPWDDNEQLRSEVWFGSALSLWPLLVATAVDEFRRLCFGTTAKGEEQVKSLLRRGTGNFVEAFSLRRTLAALLSSPTPGECPRLCWLRISLTAVLLLLHVTQGSKWHGLSDLERADPVMIFVRPLPLVQDAFILLSAYLCVVSHVRDSSAEIASATKDGSGRVGFQTSCISRLGRCLVRVARKYLRQLPVPLLWAWVYIRILPYVAYNPYNHTYPWFGLRWFHKTGACMEMRWRYSYLLGNLGHLFFRDGGGEWHASNGNPCANLWNFQLEIEAFAVVSCLLALPPRLGSAALVAIVAATTGVSKGLPRGEGLWLLYHARGVSTMLLSLRALGLPRPHVPLRRHREAVALGLALVLAALAVHGISDGEWFRASAPESTKWLAERPSLAVAVYQSSLAIGMGLLCEGCRAARAEGERGGSCALSTASRLSFGVNAAHPFVQFWIEAHASPDIRVFTIFGWLTQLAGMTFLSMAAAAFAYVLVQRPWSVLLGSGLDGLLRLGS